MFIKNTYDFFKNAWLVYYNNFSKVFTLAFQFSLICAIATITLIASEFPVWDVIAFKNFINFDFNEKIAFAVTQKKYFPYVAGWNLLVLSVAKISPLIIRIFYIAMMFLIHFSTIGFIRSLTLIYDNKQVAWFDLFINYKAVLRNWMVALMGGIIVVSLFFLTRFLMMIAGFLKIVNLVSSIQTIAPQIGFFIGYFFFSLIVVSLIALFLFFAWVGLIFCVVSYGAIVSEDSLKSLFYKALKTRFYDIFLLCAVFTALIPFLSISFFLSERLLVVTSPIFTLINQICFKGLIILPFMTFLFYGWYKKSQKDFINQ